MSEMENDQVGNMDSEGNNTDFVFNPFESLDFVSSLLLVSLMVFLILEIIYLLLPKIAKAKLHQLDFDADAGHKISYTGSISISFLLAIIITQA